MCILLLSPFGVGLGCCLTWLRRSDRNTRNFNNGMGKDARVYLDSIETLLKRLIFIMGWRNSLLLTLLIWVVLGPLGFLVTALWAAIDSHRIELHKYKITGSFVPSFGNSWSVFLFVFLLWVYCFPAYLIIRGKILKGIIPLRNEDE